MTPDRIQWRIGLDLLVVFQLEDVKVIVENLIFFVLHRIWTIYKVIPYLNHIIVIVDMPVHESKQPRLQATYQVVESHGRFVNHLGLFEVPDLELVAHLVARLRLLGDLCHDHHHVLLLINIHALDFLIRNILLENHLLCKIAKTQLNPNNFLKIKCWATIILGPISAPQISHKEEIIGVQRLDCRVDLTDLLQAQGLLLLHEALLELDPAE